MEEKCSEEKRKDEKKRNESIDISKHNQNLLFHLT